ncbi:hypothetical protein RND81_14G128700 [Saponaria officinalis]|uniref:Cell number regulator 6 n=1 Tax=Saponaria officinalis TaxID=3572 RepID=A0AAW1GPA4_SAPOF
MMAEETQTSKYVRLRNAQVSAVITPGELHQSIPTSQLPVRRCKKCRQTLHESYEAPADEQWSTGICGCAEDTESCWTGLFCPCVLFGRNVQRLREETQETVWTGPCICHGICMGGGLALAAASAFTYGIDPNLSSLLLECLYFSWITCGNYIGLVRRDLQSEYHLKNSPCNPCLVHCCCLHWCALCQEHREMKARLSLETVRSTTIVNPPPVQEMTGRNIQESATTSDAERNG